MFDLVGPVRTGIVDAVYFSERSGCVDGKAIFQATADWGTITHFGIFDASSGGNLLFHGALTESRTVNSGGQAKFLATELQIGLD